MTLLREPCCARLCLEVRCVVAAVDITKEDVGKELEVGNTLVAHNYPYLTRYCKQNFFCKQELNYSLTPYFMERDCS